MADRCPHGHDPAWLPCVYCHPEQFAASTPLTAEDRRAIVVRSAAMRNGTLQTSINSKRAIKLEGETLAGCKVLKRAADATANTRFHCEMACGHEEIRDGSDLRAQDKLGKTLQCKPCAKATAKAERTARSRGGRGA